MALAFIAMTGFENAANVAEETVNPAKTFPRALVGGMVVAGVIYVIVAVTAAALWIAAHDDPAEAIEEAWAVLQQMLRSLRAPG